MPSEKLIEVLVFVDLSTVAEKTKIPYNIDEVRLKGLLRDLGYINSETHAYATTKVFYRKDEKLEEICIPEYRTMEELGITDGTLIVIRPGEERTRYYNRGFDPYAKVLYGCPIASSVRDAISEAEAYSEGDSKVETGSVLDLRDFADEKE